MLSCLTVRRSKLSKMKMKRYYKQRGTEGIAAVDWNHVVKSLKNGKMQRQTQKKHTNIEPGLWLRPCWYYSIFRRRTLCIENRGNWIRWDSMGRTGMREERENERLTTTGPSCLAVQSQYHHEARRLRKGRREPRGKATAFSSVGGSDAAEASCWFL